MKEISERGRKTHINRYHVLPKLIKQTKHIINTKTKNKTQTQHTYMDVLFANNNQKKKNYEE